jgi:aminopeptidase-like protein
MGGVNSNAEEAALLWVLNLADGTNSLLDVALRSRLPFTAVSAAATRLENAGLLAEARASHP